MPLPKGIRAKSKVWGVCALASLCLGVAASGSTRMESAAAAQAGTPAALRASFERNCLACHTQRAKEQGRVPVALEGLDPGNVRANPELWEKVVLKMRAGQMPPSTAPRIGREERTVLLTSVESELDRLAATTPNPGRTEAFHRLNRTE